MCIVACVLLSGQLRLAIDRVKRHLVLLTGTDERWASTLQPRASEFTRGHQGAINHWHI